MGRHANKAPIRMGRAVHREHYAGMSWHPHHVCATCSYEGRHRA